MQSIVCQVESQPDLVGVTWSQGKDSFEPYQFRGDLARDFVDLAKELRARLAAVVVSYLDVARHPEKPGVVDDHRRACLALAWAGHELFRATFNPGGRPDLMYWLCRADPSALYLDDEPISPRRLRKLLRANEEAVDEGANAGLVFLNDCRTREAGENGSFLETIHHLGMCGLIATEHQTIDTFCVPVRPGAPRILPGAGRGGRAGAAAAAWPGAAGPALRCLLPARHPHLAFRGRWGRGRWCELLSKVQADQPPPARSAREKS
jgi:hypothetical protein